MERLTRRSDTGHAYYPRCFEEPCNGNGCKFKDCLFDERICERLAAYEDRNSGLFEVKECINEKTQWSGTQTLITPKGRETFRLLYPTV